SAIAGNTEKLFGFNTDFEKDIISITVASTGCTKKEHFKVKKENDTLEFIRITQDNCKGGFRKIKILYDIKEIGIDKNSQFGVLNKFIIYRR
ncbi:MAG: hypothetical protein PVG03_18955, partial [Desulfarculaceae bacterium]